jgi:hypothetical protein
MSSRDDDEQLPAQSSQDESQATPAPSSPDGNSTLRATTTTNAAASNEGKGGPAASPPQSNLNSQPSPTKPKRTLRAPSNDIDPATAQKRSLESGWSLAPIHSFDKSMPVPPELLAVGQPPSGSKPSRRTTTEVEGSSRRARSVTNPQYGRIPLPPIQSSSSPLRTSTPRTPHDAAVTSSTNKSKSPATHGKVPPSKELTEAKHLALLWLEEKKYESRASSRATGGHESHRGATDSAECAASPPWATASAGGALSSSTSPRHTSPLSSLLARDAFAVTPANPAGLFEGPKGYEAPLSYQERIHQAGKLNSAPFSMASSLGSPSHGSRPPTRDIPGSRSGRK